MEIGETEWARLGCFTGLTEIDLTLAGCAQVSGMSSVLVGPGKLLDPSRLVRIIVSPRTRARKTLDLLLPDAADRGLEVTADIREWDYGDYEGMTDVEIRGVRKKKGLDTDREWSIWRDGCPGGE